MVDVLNPASLSVILFVLIVVLIVGLLYFGDLNEYLYEGLSLEKNILGSKPALTGDIILNPDFHYPYSAWLSPQEDLHFSDSPILYRDKVDWVSDGWYENRTIDGRKDIIVIHPLSFDKGRFIERALSLPNESYKLVVGVANIRGKISYATVPNIENYGDVLILVKIKDVSENKQYIDRILIDNTEGWKDVEYDLNKFSGKDIIVRVESKAGGPHSDWDGEWAAVDYIDLLKS